MVESLGKLAFEELQRGRLIFYADDLRQCGIDLRAASVYSGMFTQIFQEERGLYQDVVFCFIHLTIQEFLAALHVHQTFVNSGINLLEEEPTTIQQPPQKLELHRLHRSAVDQALKSPNGHLDLFLRFLLGLSLPTNRSLLRGLLTQTGSSSQTNQETVRYIKEKLDESQSAERSINLFHCLNELNDRSLVEQIQQSLRAGRLSGEKMSPAQWSALVFILLSSEEDLKVFDLEKYGASEEALLRLLPVVKAAIKAQLGGCNLSERSCAALSSILSSESSSLKRLDLSNNDLQDSGVELLKEGLQSPNCTLEALSLSACLISGEGCVSLASAWSLTELDLTYNHPGESGLKLLSSALEDSHCRLDNLRVQPAGVQWLRAGLRKYSCPQTVDMTSVHREISLSDSERRLALVQRPQDYPPHPHRFQPCHQLLCERPLSARAYWEVEWSGGVHISVASSRISRKGKSDHCWFGGNDHSWSLFCCDGGYSAWHNKRGRSIPSPPPPPPPGELESSWTILQGRCPSTESLQALWSTSTPSARPSLSLCTLDLASGPGPWWLLPPRCSCVLWTQEQCPLDPLDPRSCSLIYSCG